MNFILRKYKNSDKIQVNELAVSAFKQYAPLFKSWEEEWRKFNSTLSNMSNLSESSELIVADINSSIVGAVVYNGPTTAKQPFFDPNWATIRMLVVSPHCRNIGIGHALMQDCIKRAYRDDSKLVALHTSKKMEAALALYLKMGFQFHSDSTNICGIEYGIYTKQL